MEQTTPTTNKNMIFGIVAVILVVAIIVIAVIAGNRKPAATVTPTPQGQTAQGTAVDTTAEAGAAVKPPLKGNVQKITPNERVNESSDLVTFSIAPGATILNTKDATGTIDASYVEDGMVSVELANNKYTTTKTVTGTVTGTNASGNKTFKIAITTSGLTKGAGYIVFLQANGNHKVVVPVIFE